LLTPKVIALLKQDSDGPAFVRALRQLVLRGCGKPLATHSSLGKNYEDLLWFDGVAKLYMARHDHLMRAVRIRELPATPIGESFEIKPLDFLEWYKRQNGQIPWHGLPNALLDYFQPGVDSGPVTTVPADTKAPQDACRAYLRSEMIKPFKEASFNGQDEYKHYCVKKFQLTKRGFFRIWSEIAKETGCAWATRGRPRKAT
jgi:hypothetical protein